MPIDAKKVAPVIAIIQARMGSTRLPSKVMKEISGKPILWHVINRLKGSSLIGMVAVATTIDPSDSVIEKWCDENSAPVFRGSVEDVLARFYGASVKFGAKTIVRITADCPLIDPLIVDRAIEAFTEGGHDYVGLDSNFPDGLDCEVFSFNALERAYKEAGLASEREHVTPYIWKNADKFRLFRLTNDKDLSHMRWTVDDEKDFRLVQSIYEGFKGREGIFHAEEILEFLEENRRLLEINSGTMRNEGYAKSLKEDRTV